MTIGFRALPTGQLHLSNYGFIFRSSYQCLSPKDNLKIIFSSPKSKCYFLRLLVIVCEICFSFMTAIELALSLTEHQSYVRDAYKA